MANNRIVLAPLLLGYVAGAVGIYALLVKFSPVLTDDHVTLSTASGEATHVEVIELFPADKSDDIHKAA